MRPMHTQDEHCAPYLVDDQCTACGVSHTGDCPCGGVGFHRPGCPESDETCHDARCVVCDKVKPACCADCDS